MNRIKKDMYIVFILLSLICITIGYAVLNTTLNINGKSSISKNSWDVHFDNVKVKDGSVEAVKFPVVENFTTVDFEVKLELPGDFYEFTVDVVNDGTIDAMIESIDKSPALTESQAKYFNYTITYENDEAITPKQLLQKDSFVRLKIKVELRKDINPSDLPDTEEVLNLRFTANYQQADDTGVIVPDNGEIKYLDIISGDGTKTSDEVCIGEECFYVMYSDETSVTMLSKYNLYVGRDYNNNTSESTIYGDEATGLQHPEMNGLVNDVKIRRGTIRFADGKYWKDDNYNLSAEYGTSFPAYVYDSKSTLYNYIENYKTYLTSSGLIINDARLISVEELIELGCDVNSRSCLSAPNWVYSTSYWTGSAESTNSIYNVVLLQYLDYGVPNQDIIAGIRPVIVISKDYF